MMPYRQIWLIDFEFHPSTDLLPVPVCMCAKELISGRGISFFQPDFPSSPPFSMSEDVLFVAFNAVAEISCFLALGWPIPANILDLFVEFSRHVNDRHGWPPGWTSLLKALEFFGLPSIDEFEKEAMIQLILHGGPGWSEEEQASITAYCWTDVIALEQLLPVMEPHIDLPRALFRGRYMATCAIVERHGIPIDVLSYRKLKKFWPKIQAVLIDRINIDFYQVYRKGRFTQRVMEWFLIRNQIPWSRTAKGRLDLKAETLEHAVEQYPILAPLVELRKTLNAMRHFNFPVAVDGRNRFSLRPFAARTGRNQPRVREFIFASAAWLRMLVKPEEGTGLAYLDWSGQEFAIASALSGDILMQEAYVSSDPYLALGKHAGAIPPVGTAETHPQERALFKELSIAVQYGLQAKAFAKKIGKSLPEARYLIDGHKNRYRLFWHWSDSVVRYAALHGHLRSVFGWTRYYPWVKQESARNFPIQSAGAELLRLAVILAVEAGITILATVHDALLIQFELDKEEETISKMEEAMREASHIVLNGFELRNDRRITRYPDRFIEPRGEAMWKLIWEIIEDIENGDFPEE
jgi:DNA polymerase-1